jgi:aryl-alcohol dehydrogenase-like predicted oxidoreductase
MKYIYIKGLEKKCSQLIMGSGDLRNLDEQEQIMLEKYIQAGGNTFDTAHQYRGREAILGEWMSKQKNRQELVILTKGAHHDDGSPGPRVNPLAITKDLTESLDRLGTDYVDLYALHRDDPDVAVGPIIEVLNEHIAASRIRAIGASNWSWQRIQAANEYASSHGLIGFTFNSPNLSLAVPNEPRWAGCVSADRETCNWHQQNQLALLAWSSQAGGFFSGQFTPDHQSDLEMVRVFYSEGNWERYRRAKKLAEEKNVTPIQIALAYVLNQRFPTCAIIGPRNAAEFDSSLKAMDVQVTQQEMEWLDLKQEDKRI